jgi:hypothetical protein
MPLVTEEIEEVTQPIINEIDNTGLLMEVIMDFI